MHRVQGCRPVIRGPSWLCTVVPWPAHLRFRPSKSPRVSLFLQRLPSPAFRSPLHCWQPSIFGCWPPGGELHATGGYVGTISGNLSHSTQDVNSFHWVISWHSLNLTFLCLHTVYSGPIAVFKYLGHSKNSWLIDWSIDMSSGTLNRLTCSDVDRRQRPSLTMVPISSHTPAVPRTRWGERCPIGVPLSPSTVNPKRMRPSGRTDRRLTIYWLMCQNTGEQSIRTSLIATKSTNGRRRRSSDSARTSTATVSAADHPA